ncbi:uncharacterized protein LOC114580852 [Dendrobium catenatum]|uniref:uncharacterized protein LOC114580852 n=1 Tax=Dendrobium catenatum TaxID=906689 RepID=UPI0010A0B113|nr:uncharacterized protein LOC114580852 [Dendrobium catenatum]XP_028555445.1 uncharacterized protein LOC114580852 [Dendrobium catenatum]XP_028555446.1 uncharacterized protein LOC114580852 [Dendrobium catenatum]XP_028555447.1 uncharacterized protein LOC114580852 [Dendrobium catenatum]XP_028555448.1 uncharacterized protein LOC114580852 [Dendrobium catenatum]
MSNDWVLDSGATAHLTPDASQMINSSQYAGSDTISTANGSSLPIHNTGQGFLPLPDSTRKLYLHKILHVPLLSHNLLSIHKLTTDNKLPIIPIFGPSDAFASLGYNPPLRPSYILDHTSASSSTTPPYTKAIVASILQRPNFTYPVTLYFMNRFSHVELQPHPHLPLPHHFPYIPPHLSYSQSLRPSLHPHSTFPLLPPQLCLPARQLLHLDLLLHNPSTPKLLPHRSPTHDLSPPFIQCRLDFALAFTVPNRYSISLPPPKSPPHPPHTIKPLNPLTGELPCRPNSWPFKNRAPGPSSHLP